MTQIPNKPAADSLLPCPNPWCERSDPIEDKLCNNAWIVRCKTCDINTPIFDTEAEAITAWNTRQAADALDAKDAEIAELRRVLAEIADTPNAGWMLARQALGEPK